MADNKTRKLAAILFADIEGYTAMMQTDEKDTMLRLNRFREIVQSQVSSFDGEIIKNYGDGTLCLFSSVLDAMRCAQEIQINLQQEPKVPLRVGLHLGDVMFEANDIFGNALNIASRIESLGVPGSVLMSKNIYDKVKNQADSEFAHLGSFHFKNVEEPIKVYALANQGLVVPTSDQMSGKLKTLASNTTSSFNKLLSILLAILTLVAISAWVASERGWFEPGVSQGIAQEYKDRRVAVMLFENQTLNPDLDVFGKMISDWVTKGLMETGEANVISAANIQNQVAQAGILGGGGEFYNATGVGVVIQGRYYLQEDQLMIHANVVDAEKGEVIHALDPIQGPRSKMMDLLHEFTEEILGYWSVRKKTRHLQNPPKFQAYQKLMDAQKDFGESENDLKVEKMLIDAYQLDTTFYAPLLKLTVLYSNRGRYPVKRDSLMNFIERKNLPFSKWERLRYEAIKAGNAADCNWLRAAKLNEEMFNMDESDDNANYNAITHYVRSNYPLKAITLHDQFDQQFRDMDIDYSWREPRISRAFYANKDYERIIDLAKAYSFPKMLNSVASMHLKALIRLDSLEELDKVFNKYLEMGIYDGGGNQLFHDELIRSICEEAYLIDNNQLLSRYTAILEEYASDRLDGDIFHENMGFVSYYKGEFEKALQLWSQEKHEDGFALNRPAWHARMGFLYAQLGDTIRANEELIKLKNVEVPTMFNGNKIYHGSRILYALGKKEDAIQTQKNAIEAGAVFNVDGIWQNDVFLKPLFDDPEFQELVRPKG